MPPNKLNCRIFSKLSQDDISHILFTCIKEETPCPNTRGREYNSSLMSVIPCHLSKGSNAPIPVWH